MTTIILEDWFERKFEVKIKDANATAPKCRRHRVGLPSFRTSHCEPNTRRSPYRIHRTNRIALLNNA
jgi:hypothetical protein